jgi:hypothetical protein
MSYINNPYKNNEVLALKDQLNIRKVNTYYKLPNGKYIYENSKGYIHILDAVKELNTFRIIDYLLTDKNTCKETSRYGKFKTIQELKNHIEGSENFESN